VHLYANDQEVSSLNIATSSPAHIKWHADNVNACVVYGPAASPLNSTNLFNGSGATDSGSPGQSTGLLTATSTYTLTCFNAQNQIVATSSVKISIDAQQDVFANGHTGSITVSSGTSVGITWKSLNMNANACVIYGPANNLNYPSNAFNGSGVTILTSPQATGPLTATSYYTIQCYAGGVPMTAKTTTVNVN
jgi:hypothetical protein